MFTPNEANSFSAPSNRYNANNVVQKDSEQGSKAGEATVKSSVAFELGEFTLAPDSRDVMESSKFMVGAVRRSLSHVLAAQLERLVGD